MILTYMPDSFISQPDKPAIFRIDRNHCMNIILKLRLRFRFRLRLRLTLSTEALAKVRFQSFTFQSFTFQSLKVSEFQDLTDYRLLITDYHFTSTPFDSFLINNTHFSQFLTDLIDTIQNSLALLPGWSFMTSDIL